jgi:hypothetical protein
MPEATTLPLALAAIAGTAQHLEPRRELVTDEPLIQLAAPCKTERLSMRPAATEHVAAACAHLPVVAEHGIAKLLIAPLPLKLLGAVLPVFASAFQLATPCCLVTECVL